MTDTVSDTPRERLARELFACDEIAADGFDKDDLIRGWQEMSETMRAPYFLMADHLLSRGLAYRTDVMEEAARECDEWAAVCERVGAKSAFFAGQIFAYRNAAAAIRANASSPSPKETKNG